MGMTGVLLAVVVASTSVSVWAEESGNATSISAPKSEVAPSLTSGGLIAEFRSDDSVNQAYRFNDPKENYLNLQQEVRLGWKINDMTSLVLIGDEVLNTYGGAAAQTSAWTAADPSALFVHPIYKDDSWRITGEGRLYFRAAPSTIQNHTDQYQYAIRASDQISGRLEFSTYFSPHAYVQPGYSKYDVTSLWEERNSLAYRFNKDFSLGLGQYTQVVEYFGGVPAGLNVELYPAIEVALAPGVTLWPTVFFPVAAQYVYNGALGATNASLDNARAEFYLIVAL